MMPAIFLVVASCIISIVVAVQSGETATSPSKFSDPRSPLTGRAPERVLQIFITNQISNRINHIVTTTYATPEMLYEQAVTMGIIRDKYHSEISHNGNQSDIINEDVFGPETPPQLWMTVHPVPEGALLYKVFEGMSPNEGIPWWSKSVSCAINPWQDDCDAIGGWGFDEIGFAFGIERIEDIGSMTSIPLSLSVNVDAWTGMLHLRFLPHRIQELSLKGKSIKINLLELKYTSLRVLDLHFVNISGIDLQAVSGSRLQTLRVSSEMVMAREMLVKLTDLRLKNMTQLDSVEIGESDRIHFDQKLKRYRYQMRSGKEQPETPLIETKKRGGWFEPVRAGSAGSAFSRRHPRTRFSASRYSKPDFKKNI